MIMDAVAPLLTEKDISEDAKAFFSLLSKFKAKTIKVFVVPRQQQQVSEQHKEYRFYTILLAEKLKASIHELASSLTVLGRVTKVLNKSESINLISEYLGGAHLPDNVMQELVDELASNPDAAEFLGGTPSLDDILVKYPSVAITPIAIYR